MRKVLTEELKSQIKLDREVNGFTLTRIMEKYSLSRTTAYTAIQGLDASKVKRASPRRRVVPSIPVQAAKRPSLSKVDLGEAARQLIIARLMFQGLHVFQPLTEDTPVDLVVWTQDDRIVKCQCKYIWPSSNGRHRMCLYTHRPSNNPGKPSTKHKYTAEEVDYFLGYCLDNDSVYVIPHHAAGGRSELTFWVLREPRNNNGKVGFDHEAYRNAFELFGVDPESKITFGLTG